MSGRSTVERTWVFGYGSLVSPSSLAETLGRAVIPGAGWVRAELRGWGRRWNYGIGHWIGRPPGEATGSEFTLVALGLVASPEEATNGVVVAVDADELARLDRRERHYDRVDVTAAVRFDSAVSTASGSGIGPGDSSRVATYVPRPEAVTRYERARDAGRAAIEQRYWDLVEGAFGALGPDHLARYRASTPTPDVPVLVLERLPA